MSNKTPKLDDIHFGASVEWQRGNQNFLSDEYSRAHQWHFDGGLSIAASASPEIVPLPWSKAENVDPEEAFVASLSSCHMLFFLSIAAKRGYQIDSYVDEAIGHMGKRDDGVLFVKSVKLRPAIICSGEKQADAAAIDKIHHLAHRNCFIANSVVTEVTIEPRANPSTGHTTKHSTQTGGN